MNHQLSKQNVVGLVKFVQISVKIVGKTTWYVG